jgi:beta-glucosidase
MKFLRTSLGAAVILISACSPILKSQKSYLDASLPSAERVELLLKQMTLDEKIGQMCQYVGEPVKNVAANKDEEVEFVVGLGERATLIKEGKIGSFLKVPTYKEANYLQQLSEQSRLKIPMLNATDAIHGHGAYKGAVTLFPTQIGIASSFDPGLAYDVAKYTAHEMRATGYQWVFSPNIEVVRDLRWGRIGETFGEDPYLVGVMGREMIKGYQGNDFSGANKVIACAKHFVAGGISYNGLNGAPADVSERTLNEIFFPPFIEAIKANVYTIMPAHNEVNGIPCHSHEEYLTGLIRKKWGFKGVYVSDWMDIERLYNTHKVAATEKEAAMLAVNAGLDVHMQGPNFFDNVRQLVQEGRIPMARIDDAARKILYSKFQLGLFEKKYADSTQIKNVLLKKEHLELALEGARKSIILLKNRNSILPLSKNLKSVFITGPNADNQSILGDWSEVQPDEIITTVFEGVKQTVSAQTKVDYLKWDHYDSVNNTVLSEAKTRAGMADIAIVVVGENSIRTNPNKTSGENLDRATLDVAGKQLELVKAVQSAGKPVIVVMVNGGPIASPWMAENVDGLIEAWEPGMLGGQAVADVLFGDYNPGGKLPLTIPQSVGHLQSFYNHKPSAFHRGIFYHSKRTPLYDFGFGLSYTTFKYSNLQIPKQMGLKDSLQISFTIQNTGTRKGDEVALIYLNDKISSVTTPVKKLVAFNRITLNQNESRELKFSISNDHFKLFDKNMNLILEPGEFDVIVGNDLLRGTVMAK